MNRIDNIQQRYKNGEPLTDLDAVVLLEQLTAAQRERDQARQFANSDTWRYRAEKAEAALAAEKARADEALSHAKDCESCDTSYCEMANRARKAEAQLKEAREKLGLAERKLFEAKDAFNVLDGLYAQKTRRVAELEKLFVAMLDDYDKQNTPESFPANSYNLDYLKKMSPLELLAEGRKEIMARWKISLRKNTQPALASKVLVERGEWEALLKFKHEYDETVKKALAASQVEAGEANHGY